MRRFTTLLLCCTLFMKTMAQNSTEPVSTLDDGDTSWVLTSTALVMVMTPGLAFFYGGMVSWKCVLNTLMMNWAALGILSVEWVLFGYSLTFGPGTYGIGSWVWGGLRHVTGDPNPDYASTIPHLIFAMFQMMFAVITPALVSGAVVERIKFRTWLIWCVVWSLAVYYPITHWIWSQWTVDGVVHYGWLRKLGVIDFAGGIVVHTSSGFAALAMAIIVGPRKHFVKAKTTLKPWNIPLVSIGTALLWFGWFGFNSGSALAANGVAAVAFANTTIAASSALTMWMLLEWFCTGKATTMGAMGGSIAGLACITPAAGFVIPGYSVIIGLLAAIICFGCIQLKVKYLPLDDTLEVFCTHGVGGMLGAFCTGLWATLDVNPSGADGAFYGRPALIAYQVTGIVSVAALSFVVTALSLLICKFIPHVGLRVSDENEDKGMDLTAHNEELQGVTEMKSPETAFPNGSANGNSNH